MDKRLLFLIVGWLAIIPTVPKKIILGLTMWFGKVLFDICHFGDRHEKNADLNALVFFMAVVLIAFGIHYFLSE